MSSDFHEKVEFFIYFNRNILFTSFDCSDDGIIKTVLLVYNDMDGGLRNTEPPRCRPDGSLVFNDVQGQALGPLLHVSLHSITLPTPCGHSAEPDVVHVYVMWGRKIPFLRGSAVLGVQTGQGTGIPAISMKI